MKSSDQSFRNADSDGIETVAVYSMEELAVLSVEGDDALSWLSGQVTNDVRAIPEGIAIYAIIPNSKGKVLSDLHILQAEERRFLLTVPASHLKDIKNHFDKFIVMEDVEIAVLDEILITAQGPLAATLAREHPIPASRMFRSERLSSPGIDWLVPTESADRALSTLFRAAKDLGGVSLNETEWRRLLIQEGIPRLDIDFGPQTLPQEAGLEQRAVSFTKGCYRGQEAIHMLNTRGTTPKRLCQFSFSGDFDTLEHREICTEEGKSVGFLTSGICTQEPEPTSLALGYLRRTYFEHPQPIFVGGNAITLRQEIHLPPSIALTNGHDTQVD
ncbi:MAG: hypothetical protein AAF355_10875 [Myxococcota bacterium]